jgi:transcriptional regulator with XRE-family HTH domain
MSTRRGHDCADTDQTRGMDQLGRILRRERSTRMWPQEKLAQACGVDRQQLSRYETGAATPTWATFVRVLAAFGLQPRIELDPLDADVAAAIERQRRQPAERWLADVPFSVRTLHKLLAGLEWHASGLLAVRLLGAPAPLSELEAMVVLDDDAGWERLVQNARKGRTEVWDPDDWCTGVPIDVPDLRRVSAAGGDRLHWVGIEVGLTVRVVSELPAHGVTTQVGEWSWRVLGLDWIDVDDPWTKRVLDFIRRRNKLDDSLGRTA